MEITLARIDNRLLHGITATQWAPKSKAQRIMVIDDVIANDEMMKSSMKLARPAGMAISIIPLATAITNFQNNKYENQKIFIIVKHIKTLQALRKEANVVINEINVGATAQRQAFTSDIIRVNRFVSIDKDEYAIYRNLLQDGMRIYVKYLVADQEIDLNSIIEK